MYKLIIIDDEPMIRQGLRKIIDWKSFDIEICGETDNGLDGLQLCKDINPDVVIVDIRMPGMDGLRLIEEARLHGLQSDFIILSGYSEFSYAQKATEYGVRCYLLKPIEETELLTRINDLCEIWKKRTREQEQLQSSTQLIIQHKLQHLLFRESVSDGNDEEQTLLSSHLGLPWNTYQMILIESELQQWEPEEMTYLSEHLNRHMIKHHRGVVFPIGKYMGILCEEIDPYLELDLYLSEAQEAMDLELVAAIGPNVNHFNQIGKSYQYAYEWMKKKFLSERKGSILTPLPVQVPVITIDLSAFSIGSFADHTSKAIVAGNQDLLLDILTDAESAMLQLGWYEKQIKASYISMYVELIKLLTDIEERMKAHLPTLNEIVKSIDNQRTMQDLRALVEKELLGICEHWAKEKRNNNFNSILDYISTQYCSEINLEMLAKLFHYNSSYLGKLFKSQTGESFNTYLDRIRMDKAKQLLIDDYRVYEVAEMVGYANVDYFHLKFKKAIGESPTMYREKWKTKT
ncbi:response regulator [Paenibacillus sp. V4I5]|uniref:response regulator transcription factor n=1 Tax=Paenibacillus sp. V4I5 TaxID=3042306 RepID=UPI0027930842|nr:response regulator [Paenibacillus sp. V4I5]MDQ0917975.1 two-component system response regulator YesN [Paenibacillus sp. V4I5]